MHNFMILLAGEIQRLQRYNIMTASAIVALIWIGVLYLTEIPDITFIFPLLIYVDTTAMAILLVGVTIFFERQEGSLRTLMVTPINKKDYLLTKSVVTILSSVVTLVILYIYSVFFKELNINFIGILGGVVLVALFHSLVGFLLTYSSRDFTGLLVNMMKYLFVFMLPALLEYVNIIEHNLVEVLLYITPTKAAMLLLYASTGNLESWELIYALIYMGLGSVILFFIVLRQFNIFTAKESGV